MLRVFFSFTLVFKYSVGGTLKVLVRSTSDSSSACKHDKVGITETVTSNNKVNMYKMLHYFGLSTGYKLLYNVFNGKSYEAVLFYSSHLLYAVGIPWAPIFYPSKTTLSM